MEDSAGVTFSLIANGGKMRVKLTAGRGYGKRMSGSEAGFYVRFSAANCAC
jgi:hypothetical protein